METTSQPVRSYRTRILDIVISSLLGAFIGVCLIRTIEFPHHQDYMSIDQIFTKNITVRDREGSISLDGLHGLRLLKDDQVIWRASLHPEVHGAPKAFELHTAQN